MSGSKLPVCLMLLWKEEEKAKYAYDFTHGSKKGGKKATPKLPLKLPKCSQLCFLTYSIQPHPLAQVPSSTPLGLKIFMLLRTHALLSFHTAKKRKKAVLLFALNERFHKTNFRGRTRCSTTLNTLKLNPVRV